MDIAIIGGGITGLTAAYDLAKDGHRVRILEASPETGGLAAGFPLNGTSLEKTYHHIFLTDVDIIGLAEELGLKEDQLWLPSSIGCFVGGKLLPFGTATTLLRFTPIPFFSRIRLGFVMLYLQKVTDWRRFIRVPAAEWMERACGKRAYEVLWLPLLLGKFHHYKDRVSMAWLWARINIRGRSKKSLLDKEKLGYFRGGFKTFIDALQKAAVERGAEIRTSTPVRSLRSVPGGKIAVTLDGGTETYDRVIATVPSAVFAQMVDGAPEAKPEYLAQLRSIDYLGAVCLIFTCKESLNPYYWINVLETDMPFLIFVEHTNLTGTEPYGGERVYYVGTYVPHDHPYMTDPEEKVVATLLEGVGRMFPSFDPARALQRRIFRLRNAQHVVDTGYEAKIPPYASPLPGAYLANFSQIFPEDRGTNYAVRDGRRIAAMVRDGVPPSA